MNSKVKHKEVPFGYKNVTVSDKLQLVGNLFNDIAPKYDLMNDIMSFLLHRIWKEKMLYSLNLNANSVCLDLAGGTGDIAIKIADLYSDAKVYVCDLSNNMILHGRRRAWNSGLTDSIKWICGDGAYLPFTTNKFDLVTISFGLRNCSQIEETVFEISRVLKPGGRFFCLEFSSKLEPKIKPIYDLYSFKIIPLLGKMFANNMDAYKYLVESIRRFPPPEEIETIMYNAGIRSIKSKKFLGGIAYLYSGWTT